MRDGVGGRGALAALAARGASAAVAASAAARARARTLRAQQAASTLLDDLNEILELPEGQIAWVEGPEHSPLLRVAPIDVGAVLRSRLWQIEGAPTAVLASATIPPHLGERIGLPDGSYDEMDVGSPFSYAEQALLYCPVHLPDPRAANFETAMHEELVALIEAAQGRTLALFTSWRAMQAAAEVVRQRVSWTVLTQADLPKPKLVAQFSSDEHSCLFATMGFWQGVDVPGPSLSLVTIDRLPFPRPDDPLLQARRAALRPHGLREHRSASGGNAARSGGGPFDPVAPRPRRRSRVRPAPRQGSVPVGARQLATAYATDAVSGRSRDVPRLLALWGAVLRDL